jgi:hypothetical protein
MTGFAGGFSVENGSSELLVEKNVAPN